MMSAKVSGVSKGWTSAKTRVSGYGLPYFLGALLACFLLVIAIQYGSGYYNPYSIMFLMTFLGLSGLLIPALFLARSGEKQEYKVLPGPLILFAVALLILEISLGLQDSYLHYNLNPLFPEFARGMGWLIILLVAFYLFEPFHLSIRWIPSRLVENRFTIILFLSFVLKVVTVFSSYINRIDVGIMMQESCANLLAGYNPYETATAGHAGFVYLPLHLILALPFYLFFGDTRFGAIIWELVGIIFLYRLVRKELGDFPILIRLAELVLLLFILQPRSLFIVEQAWGEPIAVGIVAVMLYLFYYKPAGPLADIIFGALLAVKQYLFFMGLPLFILYRFDWKRYLISGLTFVLIILPFLAWNPVEFYNRNVLHFLKLPIQTESLGLTAYFWNQGILIPRWMSPMVASIVALGLGYFLRSFGILGYLHTIILTFLALFILGQQAFANYYYLLSFFQITAVVFFMATYFVEPVRSAAAYGESRL